MSIDEAFAYVRLLGFILVIFLCVDAIYGENLPLWWDTFILTDWLVRKLYFGTRARYRRAKIFILRLRFRVRYFLVRIPYRRSSIGRAYVRLLCKIYPNYVVRSEERPYLYVLFLYVQPWRIYLICFLCLCFHRAKRFLWFWARCAKRFFSYGRAFFVFYHTKMYHNDFTSFLFDRLRPLSFLQFTSMLGFFLFFGWALLRAGLSFYTSFFALVVFFNITWSFQGDFFFAFASLGLLLVSFLALELMGWLAFVVFFDVFRWPHRAHSFALFFPFSVFFFFFVFWFFFLLYPALTALVGFWGYAILCFFSLDFFLYYAYSICWGQRARQYNLSF